LPAPIAFLPAERKTLAFCLLMLIVLILFLIGTKNIIEALEAGVKVMCMSGRISILGNTEFRANYVTANINYISSSLPLGELSSLGCSLLYNKLHLKLDVL